MRKPNAVLRQTWTSQKEGFFSIKSRLPPPFYFLNTGEVQDMLQTQVSCGFNENTPLCYSSLTQIEYFQPAEISSSAKGYLL
jgi:hypothetical protein